MKQIATAALLTMFAVSLSAAEPVYFRIGGALERTRDTTMHDKKCTPDQEPLLFGCVNGYDGRSLGVRGDWGNSESIDLGVGIEAGRHGRLEVLLSHRIGMDMDAQANFLDAGSNQPVDTEVTSTALMLNGTWIMGYEAMHARPFVMAGAGMARNAVEDVRFGFPEIDSHATTVIPDGQNIDFAWTAGAGVAFTMTDHVSIDLGLRYTDLGKVYTDSGTATITRPSGVTHIEVAGTEADLDMIGVTLSVRWRPR